MKGRKAAKPRSREAGGEGSEGLNVVAKQRSSEAGGRVAKGWRDNR